MVTPAIVTLISFFASPLLLKWGIFWMPEFGLQSPSDESQRMLEFARDVGGNYLSILCLGVPVLALLRTMGIHSWKGYLLAGFLAAVVPSFVGLAAFAFADSGAKLTFANLGHVVMLPFSEPRGAQWVLAPPAIFGPLTSIVYWCIARPDRYSLTSEPR